MTVSAERLFVQLLYRSAAEVELEGLLKTREAIQEVIDVGSGGADLEYPRMLALDAEIEQAQRALTQRNAKIEKLTSEGDEPALRPDSRLSLLLQRQDEASEEREQLVKARNDIVRRADAAGQSDLDDEQDRRYRALTAEIADVDEEIRVRDEEIETLAALGAVKV
jgi:hypothetical protein